MIDVETSVMDTATNIRRVALGLFSERGYDRTTLREIADALNISKAAVYYHYRTKVEILDDLLRPLVEGEEKIIAEAEFEAGALGDPSCRLALVERYVDLRLDHRRVTAYALNDLAGVGKSTHLERMRANDARIVTLLANGDLSLEQRVRTSAAMGVMLAVLTMPDVPAEQLRPQLLAVVRDVLQLSS